MKTKRIVLLLTATTLLCFLDQLSKHLILHSLQHGEVAKITSWLNVTQIFNNGAAFGLFQNNTWFGIIVFILGSLAVVILSQLFVKTQNRCELYAYPLIISGAIGNLMDRIQHGKVIDFIDVHWESHHWFVFNLADAFICIGTMLLLIVSLLDMRSKKAGPNNAIKR